MKRIGILGTGSIAHLHARCWQRLPVEMIGYHDLDQAAARAFAERYGGVPFPALADFLNEVDIVDICTPGTAHADCVVAAAAAGRAVVCEKPLARHLNDCQRIIDACEEAAVPLFVAHVVRFFPQFAAAKAAIDGGEIGTPGVICTARNGSFPRFGRDNYYGNFDKSGGVIMDVGIHDIDFQRWCCGEVERVFARGLTFRGVHQRDHALILLRFASGALGHIECSWAHPPGQFRTKLEIAGDGGLMEWDSADRQPLKTAFYHPEEPSAPALRNEESPLAPDDDPYCKELAHFLDHVENGAPLLVTPHDAYMAVKVALAAIESERTGRPVDLASFEEVPG